MKQNSRILQDDEIDLGEIIKKLWNEKILILSISKQISNLLLLHRTVSLKQFCAHSLKSMLPYCALLNSTT
jgi:LPS O-antigen subunit length determinant protein (WzzB/FepE family)